MKKRKYFFMVLFAGGFLLGLFFYNIHTFVRSEEDADENVFEEFLKEESTGGQEEFLGKEAFPSQELSPMVRDIPPIQEKSLPIIFTDQSVPFVTQAPGGLWENPRYQDGCEEASLLMAILWMEERKSVQPASELNALSLAMEERLGTFYDTSIEDTFLFANEYLPEETLFLRKEVTKEDIIEEILGGKIVGVTVNGQKLENPYFTLPGPLYHMIVIRGYDPETKEFITNDPGTRLGDGYRYQEDILFSAMQNYETGKKGQVFPGEKNMIVFQR
ncbi:MAG: hypothetical protein EOM19_05615 [Candidatus Moranbacteria bacterium]|nr:hypothetical protein [Candidatus Moranbacteria bacterium]